MGPLVLQNGDKRLILANNRFCTLQAGVMVTQCLKITEKVSFNMASAASYILSSLKNGLIGGKWHNKNSNETFWVIFKHCAPSEIMSGSFSFFCCCHLQRGTSFKTLWGLLPFGKKIMLDFQVIVLKCLFNFHEIKPCLCPFYGPCHLLLFWPYFHYERLKCLSARWPFQVGCQFFRSHRL